MRLRGQSDGLVVAVVVVVVVVVVVMIMAAIVVMVMVMVMAVVPVTMVVARYVFAVVPIIADKVHRAAAGMIFSTMP
jgi:hypothetical protein